MQVIDGPIKGLKIIEPSVFGDERGYFFESYQKVRYQDEGIAGHFVQDNESSSRKYVIRGLHYQTGASAQAKLVRVVHGAVIDYAVDIRRDSPTFGKYFAVELSAANKKQFLIPRGFAHGYATLEEGTILSYKCDNYYDRESEGGIRFDDPQIAIDWPFDIKQAIVSEKDLELPYFGQHKDI